MATVMPDPRGTQDLQQDLRQATALLRDGRHDEAAALAARLTARLPRSRDAWLLASTVAQQCGRFERMLEHAQRAQALDPAHRGAELRLLECLLYCGRPDRVLGRLRQLEAAAGDDHSWLCKLAEFYTHCTRHDDALRCYRRALELAPDNTDCRFSLAAALTASGDIDGAEDALNRVIEQQPDDYDAYRNRATLRRQTAERNHIDAMRARLAAGVTRPAGEAQLCYALAKEYEDLGDYEQAFAMLKRGAGQRRKLMRYRVESDIEAMSRIAEVFDAALFARHAGGCTDSGPIFVLGLPRSGTTLVERIIASHERVASLGEINDLAYALMRTAGGGGKLELIARAAQLDFGLLGRRYLDSTRAYGAGGDFLIDKTPLNYLYLGLIQLALPNARIVHVKRSPMDACYGMYRTLFRAGYPFSYDFDDLARYYAAYRQLMRHWHALIPQAFHEVSYEALVEDQEGVSRRIIEYCGLDWQPACLAFHRNPAPVATASAVQVRQPVYRDALERWRHYERQLEPLAERLTAAGIDIGCAV